MPTPNIKSVVINPQIVDTVQQYTITVDAEAIFLFEDLDLMTWDMIETRNLIWDNIDDS